MKKLSIIFVLISLTVSQLQAQSFESFYKKSIEDYKSNPKKYLQKVCSPDFIFITGHSGEFRNFDQSIVMFSDDRVTVNYQNEIKKVVVSGEVAVVSGISVHPQPNMIYKDAYTYTFRKMNGEWKWIMAHHTKIDYKSLGISDDEAVKKAIEASTDYIYAADYDAYKKTWVDAPYISRVVVNDAGQVSRMNAVEYNSLVEDWRKNRKTPNGIKTTRSNFDTRINGTSAFVVFNQHNDNTDGTQRDSIEERYLEKINGEWKMVNVTVIPQKK